MAYAFLQQLLISSLLGLIDIAIDFYYQSERILSLLGWHYCIISVQLVFAWFNEDFTCKDHSLSSGLSEQFRLIYVFINTVFCFVLIFVIPLLNKLVVMILSRAGDSVLKNTLVISIALILYKYNGNYTRMDFWFFINISYLFFTVF